MAAHLLISYIIHERKFAIKCKGAGGARIFRQTNRLTPTDIHLPPTQWAMPLSFLEVGVFCRIEDKEQLEGKVVIDITNPLNFETWDELVVPADGSAASEIQKKLPNSKVVKGFNTNFAATLDSGKVGGEILLSCCWLLISTTLKSN